MKSGLPIPLFVIDDLIRRGRPKKAKAELNRFCAGRIRRDHRLPAAALARRLELPDLGIALLHPIVRGTGKKVESPATPREIAEYAANLSRVGAAREALQLLRSAELAKLPEARLYEAFALVSQWEYGASLPLLDRYVSHPDADPYQRLVARANLAAGLLFVSRFDEADRVLEVLERETRDRNFNLLLGHAFRLRAQAAIAVGDSAGAELWLATAERHAAEWCRWDGLLLRKWRAVLKIAKSPKQAVPELKATMADALKEGHWETVRDCAGYLAVATKDEDQLWRVYFGTPYAPFREKLLVDFGYRSSPPPSYTLTPPGAKGAILDITGETELGEDLVMGSARFRLLHALASDWFRPFRSATLFQLVHPDEHYNPHSSPPRVRMLVMRLKKVLTQRKHKVAISRVGEEGYRLLPGCPMKVNLSPIAEGRADGILDRARHSFGEKAFGLRDAASMLGLADRTLGRALLEGVEEGKLVRQGKGRATRYRFR